MKAIYIEFELSPEEKRISADFIFKKLIKKVGKRVLESLFPRANPDFEEKIDYVKYWLIEFDKQTKVPQRELGLNAEGKTILKMPYKNNLGFWTDNNLLLDDFVKQFQVIEIEEINFETKWNSFF